VPAPQAYATNAHHAYIQCTPSRIDYHRRLA
jgi:hypothetical protein